ncbi:flagellar assembly protein FliH [Bacillus sp. REN16]|uniref:flagellar assembly protein FliH n=1 Tax=Bacillus sp. REN16 TaxID=2887296 RepID=UPI001E60B2F0|nr:flagellar assembly protein FliH [Bacillus sp. REN16]MCC3357474.1 flagellar assembly protein FliH [Bacillus sp. REN16]
MSNVIKSSSAESKEIPKRIIGLKVFQTQERNQDEAEQQNLQFVSQKILDEAKQQADKIVKDAIAYSNSIRQQALVEKREWEEEKQDLYQKTLEEGFQAGMTKGKEQGYQEYTDLLSEARRIIESSKYDYDQYLDSSEEDILRLAITVAEKIIGIQLSEQPAVFSYLVKKALKEVKEHSGITIQLNPRFYQIVIEQKEELTALLGQESNLFVFPNEDLGEVDCVIESSFGKIDASVDTQLSEIKEKLLSMLMEE